MNKRIVSVIQELSNLENRITIGDLAQKYEVSQRTIRNDLNAIEAMLKEHQLESLQLEKGGWIRCAESFPELLHFLDEKDFYEYRLSKEERKRIASALLVNASGFLTLLELAEYMSVSRATIIGDLDTIKAFIQENNLNVHSHPSKGLRIEGSESQKRIFLMNLIHQDPKGEEKDLVEKLLVSDSELKGVIGKILYEQEHRYESFLGDQSFQKILMYLVIMTCRIQQGKYIEQQEYDGNRKYEMAAAILKYVSQYCRIAVNEDEVFFLCELLASSRYIKQKFSDQDSFRMQMVARMFIEQVSEAIGMDLNGDYDFFENLSNHMEAVFGSIPITYDKNPVIDQVLEEHQEIRRIVESKSSVIEEAIGRKITQEELSYIIVHVCAAIERKKNKEISFQVIVACHAGIGTSQLLLEKLKKQFNFQILDVVSSHEAKNLTPDQADFVISTVPLKECQIQHITVSPMLQDTDYLTIGNMIDRLRNSRRLPSREQKKKLSGKELMERIVPVLYEKVPEAAGELVKELGSIVSEFFQEPSEKEEHRYTPYLYQLLPPSHIQLQVRCENWEEAVRRSAQPLLQLDYIEERYIDAMIQNIKENGPYIVLSKGFAFPHEGISQGTKKLGMNLIRLEHPVNFDAQERDPVEFVCCLSATDHNTHLKAFFHLVNLLKKEEFKEELRKSKTPEELAEVIKRYEQILLTEEG